MERSASFASCSVRNAEASPRFDQRPVGVAHELFDPVVADHHAEVLGGDVFDFVRFVKHEDRIIGQNRREISLPQCQVSEEQVMVYDDDIGLEGLLPDLGDKAGIEVAALLSRARFAAGVQPVPQQRIVGQFRQFGAIARLRLVHPLLDHPQIFRIVRREEIGLAFDRLELIPAEIVAAAFHIADGKFSPQGFFEEMGCPEKKAAPAGFSWPWK